MRTSGFLLVLFLFLTGTITVYAADPLDGMIDYSEEIEQPANNNDTVSPLVNNVNQLARIENEFWYIVLLSLLCISTLIIVLSFLKTKTHSAKDIVNATGLTLIIFGTIILVMVVNTSEQLTAAIGILGAIAGYLFRSVQDHDEGNHQQANSGGK